MCIRDRLRGERSIYPEQLKNAAALLEHGPGESLLQRGGETLIFGEIVLARLANLERETAVPDKGGEGELLGFGGGLIVERGDALVLRTEGGGQREKGDADGGEQQL